MFSYLRTCHFSEWISYLYFSSFVQGSFWAVERAARAAQTRDALISSRKDMYDVWARHAALMQLLQNFVDRTAVEKAESKVAVERAELAEKKALERAELAEQEKDRLALGNMSLQR